MPTTVESGIAKQDLMDDFIRLLKQREERCAEQLNLTCHQIPHIFSVGESTYREWGNWFRRGAESVSLFPIPHHGVQFKIQSNEEALQSDWAAVGYDLYVAILKYT